MSQKRLLKELKEISNDPLPGCDVTAAQDDMYTWNVLLKGPEASPYKGGVFKLRFQFPTDYPMKPPKVFLLTPIYHPGVDTEGRVCLSILSKWTPALTVKKILLITQDFLENPCPDEPLRPDAADLLTRDYQLFLSTARNMTAKYAK